MQCAPCAGSVSGRRGGHPYRNRASAGIQDPRRDPTTPSELEYDLEINPDNGGADDFRRYINNEEVQPLINSRYRTTGETAVLGESLVGIRAMNVAMSFPF